MTTSKKRFAFTSRLIRTIGDKIALRPRGQGRICVITYHRVLDRVDPFLASEPDVTTFRWQMELLAECFNVLPLHEAVQTMRMGRTPPRSVAITFDDGYRSVHDVALPILKELGLPATVFIASGYIDKGNMWNDRIMNAVQLLRLDTLNLRDVGLGVHRVRTQTEKRLTVEIITEKSKYFKPEERLLLAERIEKLAGGARAPGLMVTSEMVRTLASNGVDIGAHTVSHPILTKLNYDDARREIVDGKKQLESIVGQHVSLFAYPNGKTDRDFDSTHMQMVKEAGFSAAFTTMAGAATRKHDQFQLPRGRPWDRTPIGFGLRLLQWLAA